ncbi:MAG: InlB B-repeat-containing protein [Propionibacteriaceae bacterium]|jgi:internalin A|nr:InlB B-repeat-containing protein [Propionibacteriaceae bacterium]
MRIARQLVAVLAAVPLVMCLSAVPADAAADVVPDKAFKACVNSELGRKSSASVSAAYLARLDYLDCEGTYAIKSLEGAQHLAAVDTLYLEGTFSDLAPLAGLGALEEVRLTSSGIVDLSAVSGWSAVESLHVDGRFTDLSPLAGLASLETLRLVGSFSDASALGSLTRLSSLALGSGELTSLDGLEPLTGLRYFALEGSAVADLDPIASLTGLEEVSLWSNDSLASLDGLAGMPELYSVAVSGAGVADFGALATLPSLSDLELSSVGLSDVTVLAGLTGLESLDLFGNSIVDVSALAGLSGLRYLYLGDNLIADVSPLASLTSLHGLSLAGNAVSDVTALSGLTALWYLDLDDNVVTDIWALPASVWEDFDNSCTSGAGVSSIRRQTIVQKSWTGTYSLPAVRTVPGGTVKWSVKSGPAKISGGKVKYTKGGTVKLAWKDKCGSFAGEVVVTVRPATFKLAFDANGGSTPKLGKKTYKSKGVTVGKAVGSVPATAHSTQLFEGWFTEPVGGTQVTADTLVDEDTPAKVYAHWAAPTSVDPCGDVQTSYVLKAPASKKGTVLLSFPGGATKAVKLSDKNVSVTGIDTATVGERTATVTVKPSGLTTTFTYRVEAGKITFDLQNDWEFIVVDFDYGKKLPKAPKVTEWGYTFKGWYTAKSGGKKYVAGKKATQTESFTVYARWSPKTLTVNFNPTEGKVSTKSKKVKYGQEYGHLPTPTLRGYDFYCWYDILERHCVYGSHTVDSTGTQTLYALWDRREY